MRATDAWAATIRAGGRARRGAKMVVLDASHPDVFEFIEAKAREEDRGRALLAAGYPLQEVVASLAFQHANHSKGEAIQRLFDQQTWSRPAGELEIPLSTIVYNMDLGEVDYFGSARTPEITVGQLVRIGIALPLFIESVEVRGHLYVDGGIIDLFPAEPVIADASIDHAFAINVMLPKRFQAEDVTGWQAHRMGVLRASRQLQQGYHLELARRSQRQLGDRLTLLDPIDHNLLRGVSFYDLFIDRRRWGELIRQGYRATRRALDSFVREDRAARRRSRNGHHRDALPDSHPMTATNDE
jgi:predicted acylesterase/phospholipase RssA